MRKFIIKWALSYIMRYRYLEHTADLYVEARGEKLEDIFANCALALYDSICDINKISYSEERMVEVEGEDYQELLVNFLNELLYLFETEGFVASDVEVVFEGKKLTARLKGETYDREKHGARYEIKAATYHGLEINEKEGYARVLFDI